MLSFPEIVAPQAAKEWLFCWGTHCLPGARVLGNLRLVARKNLQAALFCLLQSIQLSECHVRSFFFPSRCVVKTVKSRRALVLALTVTVGTAFVTFLVLGQQWLADKAGLDLNSANPKARFCQSKIGFWEEQEFLSGSPSTPN